MLGALHAKARLSNELRQLLKKIQRFSQQMNALLEMKGKYDAGAFRRDIPLRSGYEK